MLKLNEPFRVKKVFNLLVNSWDLCFENKVAILDTGSLNVLDPDEEKTDSYQDKKDNL